MVEKRFDENKKKLNFAERKNCAFYSIKEIEFFLRNFNKAFKTFKLYKFFK